jgi:alpha-ribazole phosphatase
MLWAWRHPKPHDVTGRCIGRTDVPVPARRAKRLARRIQKVARQQGWPKVVHTSPLQRCALVGRYLRRWGWTHVQDPALLELDFGTWDGQPWLEIPQVDIDAWCQNFAKHPPGGGEALQSLLNRASTWSPNSAHGHAVVVAHAGWMLARRWCHDHDQPPSQADQWPVAPVYGTLWRLP